MEWISDRKIRFLLALLGAAALWVVTAVPVINGNISGVAAVFLGAVGILAAIGTLLIFGIGLTVWFGR
jgi:hypothetical protein